MSVFEAVILGIVQGLAEFLPVSSSGHLVLFQRIFGIDEPAVTFDIFLHVATLIPVLTVFWRDILKLLKNPFQKTTYLLLVGTLPLVPVALFLKDKIELLFAGGLILGVNFLITGLLLVLADMKTEGEKNLKTMKYGDAAIIGTLQAVAVMPAISRSGATICGSLFVGLNKETAARFSFLLSIPAILGAFVFELKDILTEGADFFALGAAPMLAGFVAAMVSGFFAIGVMLRVIRSKRLSLFSYYVCALGMLIILDQTVFHLFF